MAGKRFIPVTHPGLLAYGLGDRAAWVGFLPILMGALFFVLALVSPRPE